MPAIGNIVVKKNDNTTDVTWTGVSGSGGDGSPAIYQGGGTIATSAASLPELRIVTREVKGGKARVARATGRYHQLFTDSTTGLVSPAASLKFAAEFEIPNDMKDSDVYEGVSQLVHLMASSAIKDQLKTRRAAT